MLVLLTKDHVIPTQQVCQSCMFASQAGQPRWRDGHLTCGQTRKATLTHGQRQECPMGFRVVEVE